LPLISIPTQNGEEPKLTHKIETKGGSILLDHFKLNHPT